MAEKIQYQAFHVPLVGDVDTKTDPKSAEAGKLVASNNAEFEVVGVMNKRPGTQVMALTKENGGAINAARIRGVAARGDELVMFAEGRCWSWIDKDSKWADRGYFESVHVEQEPVHASRGGMTQPDSATLGNVTVHAWWESLISGSIGVRWLARDNVTGATFQSPSDAFVANAGRPRVVATSSRILLFYRDGASTLKMRVIDPADVYNTIVSAATTITTDMKEVITSTTDDYYDVKQTASGKVIVAWTTQAGPGLQYSIMRLTALGAVDIAAITKARASSSAIAISANATTGTVAVARVVTAANVDVKLDWLTESTLADAGTVNVAVATVASGATANFKQLTVIVRTSGSANLLVEETSWVSGSINIDRTVHSYQITSGGAVTSDSLIHRCRLGSHPVLWDDSGTERCFVYVLFASTLQSCWFLVDVDQPATNTNGALVQAVTDTLGVVARILPAYGGSAAGTTGDPRGFLTSIQNIGGNAIQCPLLKRIPLSSTHGGVFTENSIVMVKTTFADSRAYNCVEEGDVLYIPGGYLAQYDGVQVSEVNFFTYMEPADVTGTAVAGAGSLTSGTYSYLAVLEWKNSRGEIERSFGIPITVLVSGAGVDTVELVYKTLPATLKKNVLIKFYRTVVNPPADAVYYLLEGGGANFTNFIGTGITGYVDVDSDGVLLDNELYPFGGGAPGVELEPLAPPPPRAIAAGQSRIFCLDPEDSNLIHFSRLRFDGEIVSFNDALRIITSHEGGKSTGVDVTDVGVMIFKERAVYYTSGIGPDNTGSDPFPEPQKIAIDIGTQDPRGIMRCPLGVVFKSDKGYYLIDRSGQARYIGVGVHSIQSAGFSVGAFSVPDKHQVRFVTQGADILVYDYLVNQWSAWASPGFGTFLHGVMRGSMGIPVVLTSKGPMIQSTDSKDDGSTVTLLAETAWIKPHELVGQSRGASQGYSRCRFYEIIGQFYSAGNIGIRIAYNYDDTTWAEDFNVAPVTPSGGALASGQPLRIKRRFAQQRIEAVKFQIRTLATGAGCSFNAVSVEVGLKKGLFYAGKNQTY